MCTAVGVYLNYELFHWCCHGKDDRLVRHTPFINTAASGRASLGLADL